jgi:hypothetical protein
MDPMLRTFLLGQLNTIETQIQALKAMIGVVSNSNVIQKVNSPSKVQNIDLEIDKRVGALFEEFKPEINDDLGDAV